MVVSCFKLGLSLVNLTRTSCTKPLIKLQFGCCRYYSYELRGYQQECIKACLAAFESGKRRVAVSLPTGSGKTVS